MKAIRVHTQGGPEVLRIDDMDIPQPGSKEVLIRIKAAALNHLDLWVRSRMPGVPLPIIMGSDGAGIIESCGNEVNSYQAGDEVFLVPFRTEMPFGSHEELSPVYQILGEHLDGSQAEYIVAPEDFVLRKPAILSWEETAAFPLAFLTAYHMLTQKVQLTADQTLLIWGASSGIGSTAIQIAKLAGATVITTAGSEKKKSLAADLGADHIINYKTEDVGTRVKEITNGIGVDIIFEHVGEKSWQHSLKALKKGGKIITCGATTGSLVRIDLRHLFMKHQQIIGSTMGNRQDLVEICQLIADKKLKPVISDILPFSEVGKAHQILESNQQNGKIVLRFD
ncbi:MAG: alcohol dehydrogenase [Calditrichales bacterium]|nr:MAG: alcohol dehydrogenase [Calditrichales bacterium]